MFWYYLFAIFTVLGDGNSTVAALANNLGDTILLGDILVREVKLEGGYHW